MLGTQLGIVSGVATHLEQLFNSPLQKKYNFVHFEIGGQGKQEKILGKIKRFILSPLQLLVMLHKVNPDIVHFNTSFDAKAFWRDTVYFFVTRLSGKKTVYQVHGGALPNEFFRGHKLLNNFLKRFLRTPDVIVVLSFIEQRIYYEFCRPSQLRVIPNAIDLEPYAKSLEKNFNKKIFNLVYLGSLTPGKGLTETVEALGILNKDTKFPDFRYLIAGTGKLEVPLKNRIKELNLQDKVEFLGPLFGSNKWRFWNDAHLFIFPSHSEGLPYSLLESLASGTPVITTAVGAIPEVVEDKTHGLLVKPGDVEGLTNAIKLLISSPDRLKTQSLNCIKRAHEFYGIIRLADQFDEIYQFLLRME